MIWILVILVMAILVLLIIISMHYVVTSKKPEDKKIEYLNGIYEILELCKLESGESNISKRIDEIMENIRYGDVNSPETSKSVETQIMGKTSELFDNIKNKKNVEVNVNLDELTQLVKERRIISRYNK